MFKNIIINRVETWAENQPALGDDFLGFASLSLLPRLARVITSLPDKQRLQLNDRELMHVFKWIDFPPLVCAALISADFVFWTWPGCYGCQNSVCQWKQSMFWRPYSSYGNTDLLISPLLQCSWCCSPVEGSHDRHPPTLFHPSSGSWPVERLVCSHECEHQVTATDCGAHK